MNIKNKIKIIIDTIVKRTEWYDDNIFAYCKKFWKQNTFDLDVVNLGSSSGVFSFDYSDISLKCANWAMPSQSYFIDKLIIENYHSYIKAEGGYVIIPLCPFSCLGGNYHFLEDKYYTILNASSIPYFSYIKKQKVLNIKNNPINHIPFVSILKIFLIKKRNKMDEQSIDKDADKWLKLWKDEFSITDFSWPFSLVNKDRFEESTKRLQELIDFCLNRKMKPILVIPPMTKNLSKKFTLEMREKLIYSFVNEANIFDIPFYDYMDDERFQNNTLFRNSYFLNEQGAKVFTKQLLSDMDILK